MLDIKGKIITTDAMGCQKDIAEKIQKQGGDYLFAVKGNQGRLNKAFEEKFPLKELNNPEHDSYAMSERVTAEKKSVFILFAMSLMNLLISRLNGKD
ncbi:H repeat-containing Rhs element protein [Escherichia coli]|nr:H repeat-containing Rhs element protein [Escherichia coli]